MTPSAGECVPISRGIALLPQEAMRNEFAKFLASRYDQTGDHAFLDRAIEVTQGAITELAAGNDHQPIIQANLAGLYGTKFYLTNQSGDLRHGIKLGYAALSGIHVTHPYRPGFLSTLARLHKALFLHAGDPEDLRRAMDKAEESITTTTPEYPERADQLCDLATLLWIKARADGNFGDLENAISNAGKAKEFAHHDRTKARVFTDLGGILWSRFESTGEPDDLHNAIDYAKSALELTPPSDHKDRPGRLGNLSSMLLSRFRSVGDFEDLKEAINLGRQTLELTKSEHPARAGRMSDLANALASKFEKSERPKDVEDIKEAIDLAKKALHTMHDESPDRPALLNNLAVYSELKFRYLQSTDDLEEAIKIAGDAVAATPSAHAERASRLGNKGAYSGLRFDQTKNPADLDNAIAVCDEATQATPEDHYDRAGRLLNLGNLWAKKFKLTRDPNHYRETVRHLRQAVNSRSSPPQHRIRAAIQAAKVLEQKKEWLELSDITETAIKLLPRLSPRALGLVDQQHALQPFAGLAALAATSALEAGKGAPAALKLLEAGRGIILGLRADVRLDLTDLKERHAEGADLADRFERLRDELDFPTSPNGLEDLGELRGSTSALARGRRHIASREFDNVIRCIRGLEGFEEFLEPPSTKTLRAAGCAGPAVVINVNWHRCDAFIIQPRSKRTEPRAERQRQDIRCLPLPRLQLPEVEENLRRLTAIRTKSGSLGDKNQMSSILQWLWDCAIGEILQDLGFNGPPCNNDSWPRVWWIPAGQMSMFPLHAAGWFASPTRKRYDSVLDRVVSSYSPSIKVLLQMRQKVSQQAGLHPAPPRQAFIVSMSSTLGLSNLQYAAHEAKAVVDILAPMVSVTHLCEPEKQTVLNLLDDCYVFHFAGHGISDVMDPSKSRLILKGGGQNPLIVGDIISLKLNRRSPLLAYLAACSTAESKVEGLRDEAIHIASACQLAGFRHVVGSLWEISDEHSVAAAKCVYESLVNGQGEDSAIALGVHRAARMLRGDTFAPGKASTPAIVRVRQSFGYVVKLCLGMIRLGKERKGDANRTATVPEFVGLRKGIDPLTWAPYIHVGP